MFLLVRHSPSLIYSCQYHRCQLSPNFGDGPPSPQGALICPQMLTLRRAFQFSERFILTSQETLISLMIMKFNPAIHESTFTEELLKRATPPKPSKARVAQSLQPPISSVLFMTFQYFSENLSYYAPIVLILKPKLQVLPLKSVQVLFTFDDDIILLCNNGCG